MEEKVFKPLVDKVYLSLLAFTLGVMLALTVLLAFKAPISLIPLVPIDLLVLYFVVSPFFGYVKLGEDRLYIRFGIILKREIPYDKIRSAEKVRKFYSDSMLSLKTAMEHVNIRYNTFDIVSVSVVGSDSLISFLLGL